MYENKIMYNKKYNEIIGRAYLDVVHLCLWTMNLYDLFYDYLWFLELLSAWWLFLELLG
jgi:hypothetical protein